MAFKVRCPGCGKRVKVSEADAGQAAVCPACGGRVDVPAPPLLGPVRAGQTLGGAPAPATPPPAVPPAPDSNAETDAPLEGTVTLALADDELVPLVTEQSV